MLFRTSDDVDLNVVESGDPDAAATVLFAHGWTSALDVWDPVVAALGPGVRTVRYDHRGHGGSAFGPAETTTLDRLADDMAELIAATAPTGPLVLVGHSMGGMTMMALAERHPDLARRVDAALFVSTSSGGMRDVTFGLPKPLVRAVMKRRNPLGGPPRPPAPSAPARRRRPAVRIEPPAALRTAASLIALRWLVFGTRFRMVDVRATAVHAAKTHRRTAAILGREIGRHDRVDALAAYAGADVRVLVGDRDRLTPVDHAMAIAAALPNAEFVLYPHAGHMLPFERVRELAAHITRAVPPPRTSTRQSPSRMP